MAQDTEYRWCEKDIDNALALEVLARAFSEARIRDLIERGADVNSLSDGESLLMWAMFFANEGDERCIHLLVEMGADVNYQSAEGGCVLYDAAYFATPAIVEYLLQRGANPNVFLENGDTVLDEIESDAWYTRRESSIDPACPYAVMARKLDETVDLLKRYGAKSLFELHTTRVQQEVRVFAGYETGLMTCGGNIEMDAIVGLTGPFRSHFKAWKAAFRDPCRNNGSVKPASFDRSQHNEWGRRVCRVIRAALASDISVAYRTLDAKDEGIVNWERIQ